MAQRFDGAVQRAALAGFAVLACVACRTERPEPVPPRGPLALATGERAREAPPADPIAAAAPAPGAQTQPLSGSERAETLDYLTEAIQAARFEQEIAQLAETRAASGALREYARTALLDGRASEGELRKIAASRRIELPERLDFGHASAIDQLGALSGPAFDVQYIAFEAQEHASVIRSTERATAGLRDPDLAGFARRAGDSARRRRAALGALETGIKAEGGTQR